MSKFSKMMILLLFMIVGYVVISPYITLYAMYRAIDNQQGEKFVQYVDFTSLKSSIKNELQLKSQQDLSFREKVQYKILSSKLSDKLLDKVFTEKTVIKYINKHDLIQHQPDSFEDTMSGLLGLIGLDDGVGHSPQTSGSTQSSRKEENRLDYQLSYHSFDRFDIVLYESSSHQQLATIILQRKNMIFWKISAIMLPQ